MPVALNNQRKIIIVAVLVGAISMLHYFTRQSSMYQHIFYRELYFLPLILAGFWFGLRGGLVTSLAITSFFLPFTLIHWRGFSTDDLDKILEIILYNGVAVILGILRDRAKRREQEKVETILAMAGSVAHELNTPLYVALGNSQLLQSELEPGSRLHRELQEIVNSLKEISHLIKKIAQIDRPELKEYVGNSRIVDLDKSSEQNRDTVVETKPS